MEKLKMESVSIAEDSLNKIAELFPNVVTESMGKDGQLHKAIDSIHEISVKKNAMWVKMDFVSAAEYYKISPYDFLESFANEKYKIPDKVYGKYQYYSPIIVSDSKKVPINIRIVREYSRRE